MSAGTLSNPTGLDCRVTRLCLILLPTATLTQVHNTWQMQAWASGRVADKAQASSSSSQVSRAHLSHVWMSLPFVRRASCTLQQLEGGAPVSICRQAIHTGARHSPQLLLAAKHLHTYLMSMAASCPVLFWYTCNAHCSLDMDKQCICMSAVSHSLHKATACMLGDGLSR